MLAQESINGDSAEPAILSSPARFRCGPSFASLGHDRRLYRYSSSTTFKIELRHDRLSDGIQNRTRGNERLGNQVLGSGPNSGRGEGSGTTAGGFAKPADPADRPGASGHRFGPDLACSECGVAWDVHQRDPSPCKTDEPEASSGTVAADAFSRRPSGDFATAPSSGTAMPSAAAGDSAGADASKSD